MPSSPKPTPAEQLAVHQAAAPQFWQAIVDAEIDQLLQDRAAARPFITETPDRIEFYFPIHGRLWGPHPDTPLYFERGPDGRWTCSHDQLKTGQNALAGRLRQIWNKRVQDLDTEFIAALRRRNALPDRYEIYQLESPVYALRQGLCLAAAVRNHGGAVPNFSQLAARLRKLLDPERSSPTAEYAGANPPAGLEDYCRRHANALNAARRKNGPMALQYWLLNIALQDPTAAPPDPDTVNRQAAEHFAQALLKKYRGQAAAIWDYHKALPPELLLAKTPPAPNDSAELQALLPDQPPQPEIHRIFAQRKTHALRQAKQSKPALPGIQNWLKWLNQEVKAAADPGPLLVTFETLTLAPKPTILEINRIFQSNEKDPAEAHRQLTRLLNPKGYRKAAQARQEVRETAVNQQAAMADAANRVEVQLSSHLKVLALNELKLAVQPDGRLELTPGTDRGIPWLYPEGLSAALRYRMLQRAAGQFDLYEKFSRMTRQLLQDLSPEWDALPPDAAALAWQELYYKGYCRSGRRWLDWVHEQARDCIDRLLLATQDQLDPGLIKHLTRLLPQDQPIAMAAYNAAVAAGPDWPQLVKSNPGTAAWWLSGGSLREPVNHIGQVITQCRQEYAAAGGHSWRTLARTPFLPLYAELHPDSTPTMANRRRRKAAWLLNRLPQNPNRQTLPDRKLIATLLSAEELDLPHHAALTELFLQEYHDQNGLWPEALSQLSDLRDWARQQPANQPLPAKTWRRARRRSAAWHRDYAERQIQEQREKLLAEQNGQIRAWNAALPKWTDPKSGYAFAVIDDEAQLIAESETMRHCVGGKYYSDRCWEGHARIYHLDTGQGEFTIELLTDPKPGKNGALGCRTGQVRGPRNRAAPQAVKQAADRLALAYQEAQARLPQSRHQSYWSRPSAQ